MTINITDLDGQAHSIDLDHIGNQALHIDCMELMRALPDKCVDLIITSPPYNLGATHHTGGNRFKAYSTYSDDMPESEYMSWQTDVLNECYRILSDEGSMFYNHKNRIKDGVSITPYEWILKSEFLIKQEIVWFNRSQNFDKIRFYPMTERVYWLAKNAKTKLENVINHHDLFDWRPEGTAEEHKRAFPMSMVTDIIACFPKANLVFDPYLGSGTARVGAYEFSKSFLGCEIDKDYYEQGCQRYESYAAQCKLF